MSVVERNVPAVACPDAEPPIAAEPETAPMAALIDRIVSVHHARLRQELPRLLRLADRVADLHGAREPALGELREILVVLKVDLESHMLKEEWCVFPKIKAWECARAGGQCDCDLECSFCKLERDHQDAWAALARLRALTDEFTAPRDACATYRVLLDGLAALEAELHQHVFEEHELLLPRACVAAALLRAREALSTGRP